MKKKGESYQYATTSAKQPRKRWQRQRGIMQENQLVKKWRTRKDSNL
ncbi:hypothetical protein [Brucella sp. 10RB9215]|nr:hypothetical protein [Brucella sp. 10RB9215]